MSKTPSEQIQKILRDNNLKIDFEISFPKYKEIPEEVKLAMLIASKHGMKISFVLQELETKI